MYKVVFCGTPQIAVEILKGLEEIGVEIVGVVTQPDKIQGRKKELVAPEVKVYALEKNLTVFQPQKIGEIKEELKNLNPDFLITCAYGQFLPESILNLFKNAINVHASLLPKYRGGSPIQYAILNGESKTGISLMQMVKKMDAGDVYVQEEINISNEDDSGSLFEKMGVLGNSMIKKYLIDIFEEKINPKPQDESLVTFAYNLQNDEEMIDWNKPAQAVVDFTRALSPKPIAFTYLGEERIKIKKMRLVGSDENFIALRMATLPGMIMSLDQEGIIVQTQQGYVKILELQRPGKTMMSAGNLMNANHPLFRRGAIFFKEPRKWQ